MATLDVALFIADKLFDVAKYVNERNRTVEILVTKMFFKPDVRMPAMWEFDEDTFQNGMPVKLINHSKDRHYAVSFFRFETSYVEGNKAIKESHTRMMLDESHKNYDLAPGHATSFSLPWESAMYSAA